MTTDPITEAVARAICWGDGETCRCDSAEKCTEWESWREDATAAIRALYGALEKEGWQVVPREATVDMRKNATGDAGKTDSITFDQVWSWMSAAAPKPPGAG